MRHTLLIILALRGGSGKEQNLILAWLISFAVVVFSRETPLLQFAKRSAMKDLCFGATNAVYDTGG